MELKKDGDKIVAEEKYFLEGQVFNNHHGGMILHEGHIYAGHQQNEGFPTCVKMQSGKLSGAVDCEAPAVARLRSCSSMDT
ncbi:MAG UNVERIFIED_CONTAM: hypothetical protein LVR18_49460 [Planctomycetaceae bacterium]